MGPPRASRDPLPTWRKKLSLLRAYAWGRPVFCTWQVTYACHFRCAFCGYWRDRTPPDQLLTADGFRQGADRLARMGSLIISVAGGEPLLRPDLPEIIRSLARWHFPLMTTNGWYMDARTAQRLWQAGLYGASVSLDYADPQRHDRRRGASGAFGRAVQALRHLVDQRTDPRQRVSIMCVAMHDNVGQIEPLLKLARRLGTCVTVQPYCTMKTGDTRFCAPPGLTRTLLGLRRRYPNLFSSRRYLSRFDEARTRGVGACRAGRAFFNIDHRGQVAVCVERRHRPLGRVTELDVPTLRRRLWRASAGNRCRACWYSCRGETESLYAPAGLLGSLPLLLDARTAPAGRGA